MKKIIFSIFILTNLIANDYLSGLEHYKKQHYSKALELFNKAAQENNDKAMFALSVIYFNGDGVKKDIDKSLLWAKKSAFFGNINAYEKLGNYNASKTNYKEAFNWFEKAAKRGSAKSQYNLGYFYTGGLGVKRDLDKALFWYTKSAEQNHIDAQLNLGFMYIAGHGTKVDYSKAVYWIKKAKELGSQKANEMWKEFKLDQY